MAEPKCPSCRAKGASHIVSQESKEESTSGEAWFDIVYCKECGHVYGVFPKVVHTIGIPKNN